VSGPLPNLTHTALHRDPVQYFQLLRGRNHHRLDWNLGSR
jgi:hypothetical protein